jgi:hypothetical protein
MMRSGNVENGIIGAIKHVLYYIISTPCEIVAAEIIEVSCESEDPKRAV